jgi:lysophospholipase L1-like esterase
VRLVLITLLVLGVTPACAQAFSLESSQAEKGWIALTARDTGDAMRVSITEAGTAIADLQPANGQAAVRHAAAWRCDRLDRTFTATASYPDGSTSTATTSIRTPSCAKRFALSLRPLRGRIRVAISDRWKLGASPRVCVDPPGRKPVCRGLAVPTRRTYRGTGVWTVSVGAAKRSAYVRRAGKLRLLAAGDSMIQIVDTYLKERLAKRRIGVRSDARISTGLSKPFLLNWPRLAARQARKLHPDVTVVFIGANDGFPFGDIDCCGDAWVDAYAKRAEAMMRSYSRQNRGLVYWLTLPAPQPAQWKPVYPAVNRAIKRAAARVGGSTRVLDIARTFTPGYRFRRSMVWHGHRQTVRQDDGVHLSPNGASITETLIQRALRKDRVL